MDLLHSASAAVTQSEDSERRAVFEPLSVSSGNARSFGGGYHGGVENQRPLPELNAGLSMTQQLQFPSPLIKLGSNDTSTLSLERKPKQNALRPHRSKPLTNADRPYLVHPKYLEYRSRPRQDIGPDGKPIWPDRIEAAFQNALVHIKPMGRKKCSQRGRPYGRNMLIAEWIYRETGEVRVRKQVSSHIQVLDRFLKGIPEWDRLIKPGDDEETSPTEGHKFYHNSIEHMVNEQKALRGGTHQGEEFEAYNSSDRDASADNVSLQRLTFEMWVSQPDDWEHAMHHYTQLQSFKLDPVSLDDIVDWQAAFPHLPPIVDTWSGANQCELILLEASFQLMDDFPPRHSKLGIGLELDFLNQNRSTRSRLADFKDWICVTHMYRDGREICDPTHEECRASGRGKIKPFFQSRWWASTFTSLTEAKRLAEDSKDLGAIELANQHSSNFFRSLTIMQELSAIDTRPGQYGDKHTRKSRQRKTVLLWRFSEAPLGSGGTTTWRSVYMPPSDDLPTNSTLSSGEMGLPPLSMHSIDDCSPNIGSFDSSTQFLSHNNLPYNMYLGTMDEELCQDGFMSFKSDQFADSGHLISSFPLPSTQDFLPSGHISPLTGDPDISHDDMHAMDADHSLESANVFELPELKKNPSTHSDTTYMKEMLHETGQKSTDLHAYPLTRFNIQTHQVLQEQLGAEEHNETQELPEIKPESHSPPRPKLEEHPWAGFDQEKHDMDVLATPPQPTKARDTSWVPVDEQDEALRTALLAACSMSGLGTPSHGNPLRHRGHSRNTSRLGLPDDPRWASPSMFRPMLHSHHSFPGLRSMQDAYGDVQCGPPFEDHDGAHGLALLQCQLRQNVDEQPAASMAQDDSHAGGDAYNGGRGLIRAQSEPDPGPLRLSGPSPTVRSSLVELDHKYPVNETVEEASMGSPNEMQSQLAPAEDTEMGDSLVEVSMDDLQG